MTEVRTGYMQVALVGRLVYNGIRIGGLFMSYIPEKIRITCQELKRISIAERVPLQAVEYCPTETYKMDNSFPADGWQPYMPGTMLAGRDRHFWFRARFSVPPGEENLAYFLQAGAGDRELWDSPDPQGLVYLNGEMIQGCDRNHTQVFLEPGKDYTLHYYFYLGMKEIRVPVKLWLCKLDIRSEQLYYDMQTALDSCLLLHENDDNRIAVLNVLEQTANRIDLRIPGSPEYYRSVEAASQYIADALYAQLCSTQGKPVVACIGHTHIDVEYLWSRRQTREKIQRSAATAVALMERYPEYRFMLSQPELYRYLQEEAPEVFEKVRALASVGRWEPEGAMWVEADCNLISGESFVRQILQGKAWFREHFGVDCKILFLPDVFGYSAAMPQILRKSGIRHFVTSKISWSDTNTMPVDCFLWQGIDGSEIFTNFITAQEYTAPEPGRFTTYIGTLTPSQVKGTWNRFRQKEYSRRAMTTFGYGDGGGGPDRHMLEMQRRLAKGLPGMPVTEITSLLSHLDQVREEFDRGCALTKRTPKWVGELYLEFHRGTYTSMAKVKRSNRKAEFALQKAEALSSADILFGGNYDSDGLKQVWLRILHNQFHDIIPGSSIGEVYQGTDADYAQADQWCSHLIEEKLQRLAEGVNAQKGMLVYNSLGFSREGQIWVDGECFELEERIPAFGWKVVEPGKKTCQVSVSGLTAENAHYILTMDEAGRIRSLYHKKAGRQVFSENAPGNELQIFEDRPRRYDNWEISDYYKQKMWILDEKAEIEPIFDGSRGGFRVARSYLNSRIVQNIWLYSRSPRIDFETEILWNEHHQLLKAAFPLDIHGTEATYEIQFGHIRRPTHENTDWDKAKFEVYGHKWVDLAEYGYGVSLLNDCKYGFSTEGSTLKLTMLKCGTYPNEAADQGEHRFTYSLIPHVGDFREAGIIQHAYDLNQPLAVRPVTGECGVLPETFEMFSCNQENVILETVKKAEEGDGLILRLYEAFGKRTQAQIRTAVGGKVYLCDLMERELEQLPLEEGCIPVCLSGFEIVTLKITKE